MTLLVHVLSKRSVFFVASVFDVTDCIAFFVTNLVLGLLSR